ncbi:hypothetical protein M0804_013783 [Polistes exclamans]|nr:hypothetical protein M0804_013783 [Polistes exclamans]
MYYIHVSKTIPGGVQETIKDDVHESVSENVPEHDSKTVPEAAQTIETTINQQANSTLTLRVLLTHIYAWRKLSVLTKDTYSFSSKLHIFDKQNAGVKGNLSSKSIPLYAFQMIFSEKLVAQITKQTNNYFKCVQQYTAYKMNSRLTNWKDASVPEIYVFLYISMLMARSKKLPLR